MAVYFLCFVEKPLLCSIAHVVKSIFFSACPPANCPQDEDCTAEFVNEGGCIKCQCKCPTFNPRTDCPKNCPTKIVEGKYGCEKVITHHPTITYWILLINHVLVMGRRK